MTTKKWKAYGVVTGNTYIGEVDAETAEEAVQKAIDKADIGMCHQCSVRCEDPEITAVVLEGEEGNMVEWNERDGFKSET